MLRRWTILTLLLVWLLPGSSAGSPDWSALLEEAHGQRADDRTQAEAFLDQVLADLDVEAIDASDLANVAALFQMRAELHRGAAEYAGATEAAMQFAGLADRSGDVGLLAQAKFLRGTVEAEQGRLADAMEFFHAARQQLENLDEPTALAPIYNAIGVTHNFAGDNERAHRYFSLALEQARAAQNDRLIAIYMSNLSLVINAVEGPGAALELQREVLALGEALDDLMTVSVTRGNLCSQLVELGKLDEAQPICSRALEEIDQAGETRWRAGIRQTLGELHHARGELESALSMYEDSLALAEGVVTTVENDVLEKMADVLVALDRPNEAFDVLQRLLALRDDLQETRRREVVEELEVRYDLQRSAADLDLLRLEAELQATQLTQRNFMLVALLIILLVVLVSAVGAIRSYRVKDELKRDLAARNAELEEAVVRISELARHDSLTGLLNRRAMEELGEREVNRHRRDKTDLSVLLMDVDFFKAINDRYGHAVGDEVLCALADTLRNNFRECDLIGRWGGEEFLCILPNADLAEAERAALRIQRSLQEQPLDTTAGKLRLTLSFGLAAVTGPLDQAIAQADEAMYQAKAGGRDTIIRADGDNTGD